MRREVSEERGIKAHEFTIPLLIDACTDKKIAEDELQTVCRIIEGAIWYTIAEEVEVAATTKLT